MAWSQWSSALPRSSNARLEKHCEEARNMAHTDSVQAVCVQHRRQPVQARGCRVGQRGSPWQQPHSFVAAAWWSVKSQCSSRPLSFIQLSDGRRLTDQIQPEQLTGEARQRAVMATRAVRTNHVSERQDAALCVSCLQRPGVRCSNFSLMSSLLAPSKPPLHAI